MVSRPRAAAPSRSSRIGSVSGVPCRNRRIAGLALLVVDRDDAEPRRAHTAWPAARATASRRGTARTSWPRSSAAPPARCSDARLHGRPSRLFSCRRGAAAPSAMAARSPALPRRLGMRIAERDRRTCDAQRRQHLPTRGTNAAIRPARCIDPASRCRRSVRQTLRSTRLGPKSGKMRRNRGSPMTPHREPTSSSSMPRTRRRCATRSSPAC